MPQNAKDRLKSATPYRITNKAQIDKTIDRIQGYLGRDFKVTTEGEYGDYTRIAVQSHDFTKQDALVIDIRLGPISPAAEPSLLVRLKGTAEASSELGIGTSISPSAAVTGKSLYELREPTRNLANTIKAAFESTRKERTEGWTKEPRQVNQEFIGLSTSSKDDKYSPLRSKYGLAPSANILYGVPRQGEQLMMARGIGIAFESQEIEQEINAIRAQIASQQIGVRTPAGVMRIPLSQVGGYAIERVRKNVYRMVFTAETELIELPSGIKVPKYMVLRGASGDPEKLQKHIKLRTAMMRSRPGTLYPTRKEIDPITGKVKTVEIKPTTYQGMDPETFGQTLGENTYSPFVKSGLVSPEEQYENTVRQQLTLITAMPFHSGAIITNPRILAASSGWGVDSHNEVTLPFTQPKQIDPGLVDIKKTLAFATSVIGQSTDASEPRARRLGTAWLNDKATPIKLSPKQYRREISKASIVIPPFMNRAGTEFYRFPSEAPDGTDVIPTNALAEEIEKHVSKYGIRVENTQAVTKVTFNYTTVNDISGAPKTPAIKAGDTPISGPNQMTIKVGGQTVVLGGMTGDVKSMESAMIQSFGIQPYENKARLLGIVNPQLESWFRRTYSPDDPERPVDINSVGAEYSKYSGKGTSELYLAQKMLEYFLEDKTEATRVTDFKRYGIYTLSEDQLINVGRVHEDVLELQQKSLEKLTGKKVNLESIGIKATAVAGIDKIYDYFFKAKKGISIVMPLASEMVTEYPSKSDEINAELSTAIAEKYPTFGEALRILPELAPQTGRVSRARKGWIGLAKAYSYNLSAMEGNIFLEPNTKTVDQALAQSILDSGIFDGGDTTSEEDIIRNLQAKLGNKTLFFEKAGRFSPAPGEIIGIDQFSEAINYGESVSRYTTAYINSMKGLLNIEAGGRTDPALLAAHTRLMGGPQSRVGRIMSTGKNVARHLFGKQIPGSIGTKIRVSPVLGNQEAFMTKSQIRRLGYQMGLRAEVEFAQWEKYLQSGEEVPGMQWRYPQLAIRQAIGKAKLISEDEYIRRTGEDIKALEAIGEGTIFLGVGGVEKLIGDEDIDPGGFMLGLVPKFGRRRYRTPSGKTQYKRRLRGFSKILSKDPSYISEVADPLRDLAEVIQEANVPEFSESIKNLKSYIEGDSPVTKVGDIGAVTQEQFEAASKLEQRIRTRRGTSHIALSQMWASLAATGVPKDIIDQLTGQAMLYQETLESTKRAGTSSPIEVLSKAISFVTSKSTGTSMENQWSANAIGLRASFKEDESGKPIGWTEIFSNKDIISQKSMNTLVRTMMFTMAGMPELTNEMIAAGFADPTRFRETYDLLLSKLKGVTNFEDRQRILIGGNKLTGWNAIEAGVSSIASPFPLLGLSLAAKRFEEKALNPKNEEGAALRVFYANEEGRIIPYKGKLYTAAEFLEMPEVSNLLTIFNFRTGRGGRFERGKIPSVEEMEKFMATLPQESLANPWVRAIVGFYNGLNIKEAKQIASGTTNSANIAIARDVMTQGLQVMRASELASVMSKSPHLWETKISIASKLATQMLGTEFSKAFEIKHSKEVEQLFREGDQWERIVASSKTLSEGHALIPRGAYGQERIEAQFGGITVTGLPDFIKIVDGPDGPELHIMETKLTPNSLGQALVQNPLYAEIIRRQHKEKPDEMKSVLTSWKTAIDKFYPSVAGLPSPLGQDFVDKAMEAIAAGRIFGKIKTRESRYSNKPYEKTLNLSEVKDWDTEIQKAALEAAESLPEALQTVKMMTRTGKVVSQGGTTLGMQPIANLKPLESLLQAFQQVAKDLGKRHSMGGAIYGLGKRHKTNNPIYGNEEDEQPGENPKDWEKARKEAEEIDAGQGMSGSFDNGEVGQVSGETVEASAKPGSFIFVLNEQDAKIMLELAAKYRTQGASLLSQAAAGQQQGQPPAEAKNRYVTAQAQKFMRLSNIQKGVASYNMMQQLQVGMLQKIQEMQKASGIGGEIKDWADVEQFFAIAEGTAPQTAASMAKELLPSLKGYVSGSTAVHQAIQAAGRGQIPADLESLMTPELVSEVRSMVAAYGDEDQTMSIISQMAKRATGEAVFAEKETATGPFKELSSKDATNIISEATEQIEKINTALKPFETGLKDSSKALNLHSAEGRKAASELTRAIQEPSTNLAKLSGQISELEKGLQGIGVIQGKAVRTVTEAGVERQVPLTEAETRQAAQDAASLTKLKGQYAKLALEPTETSGMAVEKLGQGLRNIFGGFGFFYMQRVLGIGVEAMTQGAKEYEQYREGLAGVESKFVSTAAAQRETPYTRRQLQLIRAGGAAQGAVMDFANQFIGTPTGDIINAGKLAGGVGLAGLFGMSELAGVFAPGMGMTTSAFAGAALPYIGAAAGIAAVGGLALQQTAYARDPKSAIIRAIAEQELQPIRQKWGPGVTINTGQLDQIPPWSMAWAYTTRTFRPESEEAIREYEATRALGRQFISATGGGKFSTEEIPKIIDYAIGAAERIGFGGISPEGIATGVTIAAATGRDKQFAQKAGRLYTAGAPIEELATSAARLSGRGISLDVRAEVIDSIEENLDKIATALEGQRMLEQLPKEYYRRAYGRVPETGWDVLGEFIQKEQGEPWLKVLAATGQAAEGAALTGVSGAAAGLTGPARYWDILSLEAAAPEELRKIYQGTLLQLGKQRRAETMTTAGYTQPFIEATQRRMDQFISRYGDTGVIAGGIYESQLQQLMTSGIPNAETLATVLTTSQISGQPQYGAVMQGVMRGNPMAYAQGQILQGYESRIAAGYTPQQAQARALKPYSGGMWTPSGVRVPIEVSPQTGLITGNLPYTTSMTTADLQDMVDQGFISRSAATRIGYAAQDYKGPGGPGYTPLHMEREVFGIEAIQYKIQDEQIKATRTSAAAQQAQIDLQRRYWLGGGSMGRGIWAIQDEQRALAHEQQLWGFGTQRRQIDIGWNQFMEGTGLQQRGNQLQRSFTMQDWAYSDLTRAMQWGWKQQDFQEEARFLTGRQRRLAERGMERETIMYGLEGERIDRQKSQQKELWNLEDERINMEIKFRAESRDFALEQLTKQEEFYARNKILQDEEIELTRRYQLESLALQEGALAASITSQENILQMQRDLDGVQKAQGVIATNWTTLMSYTQEAQDIVYETALKILEAYYGIEGLVEAYKNGALGGTGESGENVEQPGGATGGHIISRKSRIVGEWGPELFTSLSSGYITPLGRNNPWNSSTIALDNTPQSSGGGATTIIINLGNEKLATFVVNTLSKELSVL